MPSRGVARAALCAAGLALACGGEDPQPSGAAFVREEQASSVERAENTAPVVESLVLNPPAPLAGQQIDARVDAYDPDGDPIRLELEWRHGGRVISSGARTTVAPEGLAKGDEVAVFVTATDGRDRSDPVRASVTVGNTAPLIRALYLAPDGEIAPGQEVSAAPNALDPDGDALEYEFEWILNGQLVHGADAGTFATDKLKRGDRLQARVRVTDGEASSPLAESMTLELANRPPRFAALPPIESSGGAFHANLEAEDPDGDRTLRFRLLKGPEGMTVDPVSGRVSWRPRQNSVGTHPVEVAVADAFGAESALGFELTVASEEPEKKAAPAKQDELGDDELDEDEGAEE
jgi:hypothetical protein